MPNRRAVRSTHAIDRSLGFKELGQSGVHRLDDTMVIGGIQSLDDGSQPIARSDEVLDRLGRAERRIDVA